MSDIGWLDGRELADPGTTAVFHIAEDGFRRWLPRILRRAPLSAICGDILAADDESGDPGPDSPVCVRCAAALGYTRGGRR